MEKTNIVLIGMPGAGKSTIGVLLAKALKKPFIDTDLLIQQKYNMFLQEIIDKYGIKRFLSIEEEVVVSVDLKNHVIATGGSVVYSDAALKHFKKDGLVVYLKLRFDEIEKRISNISSRGIAMEKGKTLVDLYNERVPLYEKYADITVNCSDMDIEASVAEIINRIKATEKIF
ncbi:MAG TPA: shikimate kinase [Acetivibrio sp.]|nr:shikimate kinase [Clostridium sp.]HOQ37829.1 shikimate kinase [Acetivibrio sp.]HQA58751.1 shikimate kinase [Acetivibrio sp.]